MPPRLIKRIERGFKNALGWPFAVFLRKGETSRVPVDPGAIESLLILRPDKLGDMVVTVPVIHALKKRFPHLTIDVLASPANRSLIENDPQVDNVFLYVKNIIRDWPVIRRLRRRRYDIIYDPICHDSITGLLLSCLIGDVAIRAAARKLNYIDYYDYCRPYRIDGDDHNIDNGFLIFNVFGVPPREVDPFCPVHIPEAARRRADRFFAGLPDSGAFRVGLNISAGSATRTLPEEKFIRVIDLVSEKHPDFEFVLFCVMAHRARARLIAEKTASPVYLIPEETSLIEAGAILSRLGMLISPDTSLVHMARLMKIPVVGLYSGHRRNFNFWRPYRQDGGAIMAGSIDHLHDITAEMIAREFDLLHARSGNPPDRLRAN